MLYFSEAVIPIDLIYNEIKSMGFKTSEWREELEERAISVGKIKLLFKNSLPQGLYSLIKTKISNFTSTKQYTMILSDFEDISAMSAKDVIEVFGDDSVIYTVKKRGSRPHDWRTGLNSEKTLIKITNKKLINALENNKVLYHIVTIDVDTKITDLENYEEDYKELFEENIFDGIIELKSNNKISYIGYY